MNKSLTVLVLGMVMGMVMEMGMGMVKEMDLVGFLHLSHLRNLV